MTISHTPPNFLEMEFLAQFLILTILIAAGLLILNPTSTPVEEPDVTARLKGVCGDTMQISLKIKDGVITSVVDSEAIEKAGGRQRKISS